MRKRIRDLLRWASSFRTDYSSDGLFRFLQREASEFLKDSFVYLEEIADTTASGRLRVAAILLRAQFEGTVEARLLLGENSDGAVHENVIMKEAHFFCDAYRKAISFPDNDAAAKVELLQKVSFVDELNKKFGWKNHPRHWSALPTIEGRAKKTGMLAMYRTFYGVLSWDAHHVAIPRLQRRETTDDAHAKSLNSIKLMSTSAQIFLKLIGRTRRYLALADDQINELEDRLKDVVGATSRLADQYL